MFEYAVDRDYIGNSPFYKMKRVIKTLRNKSRTRFLTEQEIAQVWAGITNGGGTAQTKRALKLILVTTQRPMEVAGLHRREISGDWWTLPAERNLKGIRDHRIFLTATAKELIGDSEGFIFPSPMKDTKTRHITRIAMSQHVTGSKHFGVAPWTPHDLRRTARTHMSRIRIRREYSEAVLNHAKGGMAQVYDQYEFDDEKMEALQAWETELLRLVIQSSTSV
ncbi:MAG: site-specific integrase [Desulfuromonadaceae bacterium]